MSDPMAALTGVNDPVINAQAAQRFEELVHNVYSMRQELMNRLIDPRRDLNEACGFPNNLGLEHYSVMYERDPIGCRVVQLMPRESWQLSPKVYESEDEDDVTDFEEAWDELCKNIGGQQSWYKEDNGSLIWEYLLRVDELSGIGSYGILFLGLDDGLNYETPVEGAPKDGDPDLPETEDDPYHDPLTSTMGTDAQYTGVSFALDPIKSQASPKAGKEQPNTVKTKRKLLFLRAFDETLAPIVQFETSVRNPRYGLPLMYNVTMNDPRLHHTGIGLTNMTLRVHWSRVIHVVDGLHTSEVFGIPRMQTVFNNLYNLQKLYGGSAEMYWRGAFPGLSIETHPQLGGDVKINEDKMRQAMQDYSNNLQRWIMLMGMSAKSLAPQVVEPTAQIEAQIEAICIKLGCPVRVFKGSERGELASSQDDASWNDRLRSRQNLYLTPRLIVPVINRLIMLGVLPEPEHFCIEWPDLDSMTDSDKAKNALTITQAVVAYVGGNVEATVPAQSYFTKVIGWSGPEVEEMLSAAKDAAQEDMMTMPAPGELGHPATPDQPPPPPIIAAPGMPPAAGGGKAAPPSGGAKGAVAAAPAAPAGPPKPPTANYLDYSFSLLLNEASVGLPELTPQEVEALYERFSTP